MSHWTSNKAYKLVLSIRKTTTRFWFCGKPINVAGTPPQLETED
uniref:Uncharacterized protein n=1 Tax=Salvator merianae TaxID=96440 RepID=A0A8D0DQR9_SALMN